MIKNVYLYIIPYFLIYVKRISHICLIFRKLFYLNHIFSVDKNELICYNEVVENYTRRKIMKKFLLTFLIFSVLMLTVTAFAAEEKG